jgi:DNA-binding GntR family transcriptional regulator
VINWRPDRAVYWQLAELLAARIESGEWAPGQLLPSEATLAREYELGRDTVRDALGALRAEGKVASRKGLGTFVRDAYEVKVVTVSSAARVRARMPTMEERAELGLPEGVPLLVVVDGRGRERVYPADRAEVRYRR